MVSPVYKDGGYFDLTRAGNAIAPDGSGFIEAAQGAFASVESEPYSNTAYEASRTGAGWSVTGLDPPAAMSPESNYLATSTDLRRTLWGLHRPTQSIKEEDLYIREPDGSFVEVGPLVPPSYGSGPPAGTTTTFGRAGLVHAHYIEGGGASADLSHILVNVRGEGEAQGYRWPGDTTLAGEGIDSLYEYDGIGLVQPTLLGVDNEGNLISQCGTELGSSSFAFGDRYNAVSRDGTHVFFTALAGGCVGQNNQGETVSGTGPAVNELYTRVDGAETVKISEPTFSQCKECQTGTPSPEEPATTEEPAEFAGASTDGSKVFFTTEQELSPGQATNNLYEYDFSNPGQRKIVLVSAGTSAPEVQGVARVSADGSHIYFVAKGVLTGRPNPSLAPGSQLPVAGADNLYAFIRDAAHPEGRLAFVAALSEADGGDWSSQDDRPIETTPDGRFLVFTSTADLTPDDASTVEQVFEYDAQRELLVRVSIGQCPTAGSPCSSSERADADGNAGVAPANIAVPAYALNSSPTEEGSRLDVSDDGTDVFFNSAAPLTSGATEAAADGRPSVFEYHSTDAIVGGEVYLVSDGKDTTRGRTELLSTDGSGADLFLQSGDPVLARDTNSGVDIFDARIDGGFSESAVLTRCEGESCHGASGGPPLLPMPASAILGSLEAPPASAPAKHPPTKAGGTTSPDASRAARLAKALKTCRRELKLKHKRRVACEKRARRRFGAMRKSPRR